MLILFGLRKVKYFSQGTTHFCEENLPEDVVNMGLEPEVLGVADKEMGPHIILGIKATYALLVIRYFYGTWLIPKLHHTLVALRRCGSSS